MRPGATSVRIGAGAGFAGDRVEPALELIEQGELDYIVFECLAERTIALAQRARHKDPSRGYDPMLDVRMRMLLKPALSRGVRIVTNLGAANPIGAAERIVDLARELHTGPLTVAAITGDDVLEAVLRENPPILGGPGRVSELGVDRIISANAYLGAEPIREALALGAQVVVTGRASDPALFLGPLRHEFGWARDDWTRLGRGVLVGHLLECAGQLTGGYFADPGVKDVPNLARLGFPFAEVQPDGSALLGKVDGSGGRLDLRTCKEQLLYELSDPSAYLTPDVCADFSGVQFEAVGPDRVRVRGADGTPAPETLKVSIGYLDGFVGEGQISYAGPQAVERGRLALEIVKARLELTGVTHRELRCELIGVDAVHLGADTAGERQREVRARVAARTDSLDLAWRIGAEVESLYTNGPAGGGGATRAAQPVVAIASALIPRDAVEPKITLFAA